MGFKRMTHSWLIQAQELRLSRTTAKNGFDFLDIYQESELVEATTAENEGIRFAAKQNIRVDKIEIHTSSYSGHTAGFCSTSRFWARFSG